MESLTSWSESEEEEDPINSPPLFTLFPRLPVELQLMIWRAASELNEEGICIPRIDPARRISTFVMYRTLNSDATKIPGAQDAINAMLDPLIVYFKLPTTFHVCKQSRDVARSTVLHHEDEIGACYSAHREYDPEKDIFFYTWKFFLHFRLFTFWEKRKEIKHLAIHFPNNDVKWWYFLVAWYHGVVRNQTPKVSLINVKNPDFNSSLRGQLFRIEKLFATGREAMIQFFLYWFSAYNTLERFKPLQFLSITNDSLEITFGELRRSGSVPADEIGVEF
ncbi:hypothetical protein F4805DRAFT_454180 [Annulohypoxylon moriforme]|nr:hypothetical protein F4805DRAFT_454180 [Annulohypoxylon moriforme]